MEQRVSFKSILQEKEFWLIVLLAVLMFPGIFLGETFFYRDLYLHYLPHKKLFSEMIRNGELPLWNPYLHGGQPFLAEINFSVLYPSNLLYLIFPLYTAFNVDIVGHVIFGAAAAYCLARFCGMSPLSSAVCGIVFAFCGFSLSLINLFNRMLGHPYIPMLCLLWHRFLTEKRMLWFFLSVLFCTFQIFAGAPEWTLIVLTTMLVWSLFGKYPIPISKRVGWLVLFGFGAVLTSAIQLLPTIEMMSVSSRTVSTFESFSRWSLHFERMPEFIFPNFLGRIHTLAATDYWGSQIEDSQFPFVLSIHLGIATIVLASITVFSSRMLENKNLIYGLLVLFVVGVLFSLGRFFPLTRVLYEWLPGLDRFRYPLKFLCLSILPISLLAAFGFEFQWIKKISEPSKVFLITLWVFTGLVLALCFFVVTSNPFFHELSVLLFKSEPTKTMRSGVFNSSLHVTIVLFLLSLVFTIRRLSNRNYAYLVCLILIVDLFIAGRNLNPLAPKSFYEEEPQAAKLVRQELKGGKFYRTPNPPSIVLNAPSNDILWQYRWNQEVLKDYIASSYGIPVIFNEDFDGLAQKRIMDLTNTLLVLPWEKRIPILSNAGVTVIMTHEKLNLPEVEPVYVLRNRSNALFYLYRNRSAVLPAARVSNLLEFNDLSRTLDILISEKWEPGTHAVSNEPFGLINCENISTGSMKLLKLKSRTVEYETSGSCSAALVSNLPFYKGWKVFVDGTPANLIQMNWAFSGASVSNGRHHVSLVYSPSSVRIGAIVSAASLILLLIFTVKINHAVRKA